MDKDGRYLYKLIKDLEDDLEMKLVRVIDQRMASYRQAMYVKAEWCCKEMQTFAVKVWNAAKPHNDGNAFGQTALQLKGHNINYCPFCGAHVGSK
jgi:hypothetical protein